MSIFSRVKKPAAIEPSPPPGVGGARRDGSHPLPSPLTQQPPATHTTHPTHPTRTNGVHPLPVPKPPGVTPMPGIPVASPSPPAPAPAPASVASTNGVANGKGPSHRPSNGVTVKAPPSTSAPSSTPTTTATPKPGSGPIDLVIEMALEADASEEEPPAIPVPGTSTAADQAGVRATFEDVAVPYMAEVRGLMMELQ